MARFVVTVEGGGAAFEDAPGEVARLLRVLADFVEPLPWPPHPAQPFGGRLFDANGNGCGSWELAGSGDDGGEVRPLLPSATTPNEAPDEGPATFEADHWAEVLRVGDLGGRVGMLGDVVAEVWRPGDVFEAHGTFVRLSRGLAARCWAELDRNRPAGDRGAANLRGTLRRRLAEVLGEGYR